MATKYALKNKANNTMFVQTSANPTSDKIFPIPPNGIGNLVLTDEEYNYVRSNYSSQFIIRKLS